MNELHRVAALNARVMTGDPWHAGNIAALLADVSAASAAAHPVPGAHSIWEIVLHLTGWARQATTRLEGGEAATPVEGDWPRVGTPSPARWRHARAALVTAYEDLGRAVSALPPSRLERPTKDYRESPDGAGASHDVTVHGAIHHAIYHAGQIALLKRAKRR